ncbi:MAG TPA: cytochrome c [Bryobacteraceae bacterium]|nr:cytochrome c [Bryobacteraceae bacterium]
MRRRAATLLFLAGSSLAVIAQQVPDFNAWMKQQDAAMLELRKLESKVGPQATRNAERIGGAYEEMIGFFRQQGGKDAVKWSEEGKAAAARLATAAYAGKAGEAAAAFKVIADNCNSCHKVYRTRLPDGRYAFTSEQQREAAAKKAAPAK